MVTRAEVNEHASKTSCWVIIKGVAYDLTSFLDVHPGGSRIILKYAGKDATEAFDPIHSADTLEKHLSPELNLGPVTESEGKEVAENKNPAPKPAMETQGTKKLASLKSIITIRDFELAASQILSARSFAFFKAGADDEYTAQWNRTSWQSIRFRPRVLKPIPEVTLTTTVLGNKFSSPLFICPAGGAKLAHPTGEVSLTKAAAKHNVLHWVCNNSGCTKQEISDARAGNTEQQKLYWQIYALSDLSTTEKEIRQAINLGYKGFALTVDAIRAGKRERDVRVGLQEEPNDEYDDDDGDDSFASGPTVKRSHVWTEFHWQSAIKWLRSITDLPIAIKGIQTWEDATLCMHYGVHPWLSNHAGRQLEGAPSAAETLIAIRTNCPMVFEECEVIVDGGITRGTDIVKALALGAKAVGLGRSFLYSLVFGERGVSKAIRILNHEIETTMALLGVTSIDQLNPSYRYPVHTSSFLSGVVN
ncbi:oxidoreductase [Talaromyces proteolyticus]|uniref:Oxidoreductase n=1 Tax=Talaromyces proteolyticus TaxID=1131652 RepID=A0AAD4Q1Q7_9EURO|nr:oxidoreductase [Talaromyces proteolyticus]KAH8698969.1 oxidoreductase [Talaromyces proteolyticus]